MLLCEVLIELIEIVEEVIIYVKDNMGRSLNENIYVFLMDYIYFVIECYCEGVDIKNVMLWEIKQFYKFEFILGLNMLEQIKFRFGYEFFEDEVVFIVLYIVNVEMNEEVVIMMNMIKFIQ